MLARSVSLNILGQVGSLAVGFIGSVAIARWLGPADRGLLGIMVSVVDLGMALGALGLPFAVMYYASRRDPAAGALLGNSLAYSAFLVVVFVAVFWVFGRPIADAFGHGRGGELWVVVGALVPVTFLDWTTHNQLLGALRFGLYNLLGVLSKVASLLVAVVLLGVMGIGIAGGLAATAAASLVFFFGSLRAVLIEARPRIDWGLFREMVQYGRRVQVGAIFQIAIGRLDVLILQFFRPLSEVGYYVVAQSVAELVIVVGRSFQSSVLPLVARYEGDERQAQTTEMSLRHHGLIAGGATVANAAFGSVIILFAYGPSFQPAVLPMLILLPGIWFLSTGTVAAGDLRGRGRPGLSSVLAGAAVVVTVILNLVLIPPLGVPGAALASVAAYTVFGATSLVAVAKLSQIPLGRLVVPRRADLALYLPAMRRALMRIRARGSDRPRG